VGRRWRKTEKRKKKMESRMKRTGRRKIEFQIIVMVAL